MAKKKFYYNNKNKKPQNKAERNLNDEIVRFTYTQDQLDMKIESLGLSESTETLLLNNKVHNAFDLVRRTPKDMYKIQGLNKKIYFEIVNALSNFDMKLSEPIPPKANEDDDLKQEESTKPQKAPKKTKENEPKKQNDVPKKDPKQINKENKNQQAQKQENKNPKIKESKKPQKEDKKGRRESTKVTSPLPLESWRKVTKNGKWGFSDGMKVRIDPQYDEVFSFKEGLASVELNEMCGYIDQNNQVVIPFDYETAFSFNEGFAQVSKNGKYGYINKENEVVIDFKFDAATAFEDGEAKIKQDGKWGTLTPDGEIKWI